MVGTVIVIIMRKAKVKTREIYIIQITKAVTTYDRKSISLSSLDKGSCCARLRELVQCSKSIRPKTCVCVALGAPPS